MNFPDRYSMRPKFTTSMIAISSHIQASVQGSLLRHVMAQLRDPLPAANKPVNISDHFDNPRLGQQATTEWPSVLLHCFHDPLNARRDAACL
jgi:hypothetical protein